MEAFKIILALTIAVSICSCNRPVIEQETLVVQESQGGYLVSFKVKYCFGDEVQYSSARNGSGKGKIHLMDISEDGLTTYGILLTDESIQGGIKDGEIELIKKRVP